MANAGEVEIAAVAAKGLLSGFMIAAEAMREENRVGDAMSSTVFGGNNEKTDKLIGWKDERNCQTQRKEYAVISTSVEKQQTLHPT